jgi:hypothetical protein
MLPDPLHAEKHFTIGEVCSLWGIGRESLRKIVAAEKNVVRIKMGKKKKNIHYLIPESTLAVIHTRLLNGG